MQKIMNEETLKERKNEKILAYHALDKPLIIIILEELIVPNIVITVPIHVSATQTIDKRHDSSDGILTIFSLGPAVVTYRLLKIRTFLSYNFNSIP